MNFLNHTSLLFFAVPEEIDFSWLKNVCFANVDFSAVFQRGAQSKITADVSDTKQTSRLENKEDRSVTADSSDSNDQASA